MINLNTHNEAGVMLLVGIDEIELVFNTHTFKEYIDNPVKLY